MSGSPPVLPSLQRLALAFRIRRWIGVSALSLSVGLLAGTAAGRLGATPTARIVTGFAAGVLALGTAAWIHRRRPVDGMTIARHYNRVELALEESAELLIPSPDSLTALERLERRRVEAALARIGTLPPLPKTEFRRTLIVAGVLSLLALGLGRLPSVGIRSEPPSTGSSATHPAARRPPEIRRIEIGIRPPAYTKLPVRRTSDWDLEVAEGTAVVWRVATDRPVSRVRLTTTSGDTIAFFGDSARLTVTPPRSALYQLWLEPDDGPPIASDFHQLTVRRDNPPVLAIASPAERVEFPATGPHIVPVEVLATDDYRVVSTGIVATLTTGAGEAVKFREEHWSFRTETPRGSHGLLLRTSLDLGALGLGPGDELYFHVTATDNRSPSPNESRSETVFISIADTAQAPVADLAGVALNVNPEYFRSERQIIIDTEKLLSEEPRIPNQQFRSRSADIGIDQSLLRLRYGEFLGEEFEAGAVTADAIEGAGAFTHEHDTEENATLLAHGVKATLKAAVAEMWEAELRLRTYRPQEALPYEYRALELLKEVQQAARAYVKRVGFEPPPLEPDRKRLTGDLSAIHDRHRDERVLLDPTLPAIRAALASLPALQNGRPVSLQSLDLLERAGQELAKLAVERPGVFLGSLRDLRALITSLSKDERSGSVESTCVDCLAGVEAGFWRALPTPDQAPARMAALPRALGGSLGTVGEARPEQ